MYLRERGYRVDGLGWQAHVEVGWATEDNLRELGKVIDWCQERNLEFHVTGFSAWIMDAETQTLEDQAYTFKAVMDVLLEWNTWHITDAAGWKNELIPSLFDVNFHPKPAYYTLQQSLESRGDHRAVSSVRFKNKESR